MTNRGVTFKFYAHLTMCTPLRILEMHNSISSIATPVDPTDGVWLEQMPEFEFLDEGGSMASPVGPIPRDGGDFLVYLKRLRNVVEAPASSRAESLGDALHRATQIRALPMYRTYSHGKNAMLRPNKTLADYCRFLFQTDNELLDYLLSEVHGRSYSCLTEEEKSRADGLGYGDLVSKAGRTLSEQCAYLGWPLETFSARKLAPKKWHAPSGSTGRVEEIALELASRDGEIGSCCEGQSFKVLMKAACFEVLAQHSIFPDRAAVIRPVFESHCAVLVDHRAEVINAVAHSTASSVSTALHEMFASPDFAKTYPGVALSFVTRLYDALGSPRLAELTDIFFNRPYDYRAGWPDLTFISKSGVRLMEVKTTDLLHESQVRFAQEVAAPLNLACSVVKIDPMK